MADKANPAEGEQVEGSVVEVLPGLMFRVETIAGEHVLAHVALSRRVTTGRLIPGSRVTVARSPFDRSRGRIVRVHE